MVEPSVISSNVGLPMLEEQEKTTITARRSQPRDIGENLAASSFPSPVSAKKGSMGPPPAPPPPRPTLQKSKKQARLDMVSEVSLAAVESTSPSLRTARKVSTDGPVRSKSLPPQHPNTPSSHSLMQTPTASPDRPPHHLPQRSMSSGYSSYNTTPNSWYSDFTSHFTDEDEESLSLSSYSLLSQRIEQTTFAVPLRNQPSYTQTPGSTQSLLRTPKSTTSTISSLSYPSSYPSSNRTIRTPDRDDLDVLSPTPPGSGSGSGSGRPPPQQQQQQQQPYNPRSLRQVLLAKEQQRLQRSPSTPSTATPTPTDSPRISLTQRLRPPPPPPTPSTPWQFEAEDDPQDEDASLELSMDQPLEVGSQQRPQPPPPTPSTPWQVVVDDIDDESDSIQLDNTQLDEGSLDGSLGDLFSSNDEPERLHTNTPKKPPRTTISGNTNKKVTTSILKTKGKGKSVASRDGEPDEDDMDRKSMSAPFHESLSSLHDSLKGLMLYRPDGSSDTLLSSDAEQIDKSSGRLSTMIEGGSSYLSLVEGENSATYDDKERKRKQQKEGMKLSSSATSLPDNKEESRYGHDNDTDEELSLGDIFPEEFGKKKEKPRSEHENDDEESSLGDIFADQTGNCNSNDGSNRSRRYQASPSVTFSTTVKSRRFNTNSSSSEVRTPDENEHNALQASFHESLSELQDSLKDLMLYRPDGSSASVLSSEFDKKDDMSSGRLSSMMEGSSRSNFSREDNESSCELTAGNPMEHGNYNPYEDVSLGDIVELQQISLHDIVEVSREDFDEDDDESDDEEEESLGDIVELSQREEEDELKRNRSSYSEAREGSSLSSTIVKEPGSKGSNYEEPSPSLRSAKTTSSHRSSNNGSGCRTPDEDEHDFQSIQAPFHESLSELQDSLKGLMLYHPDGSSTSLEGDNKDRSSGHLSTMTEGDEEQDGDKLLYRSTNQSVDADKGDLESSGDVAGDTSKRSGDKSRTGDDNTNHNDDEEELSLSDVFANVSSPNENKYGSTPKASEDSHDSSHHQTKQSSVTFSRTVTRRSYSNNSSRQRTPDEDEEDWQSMQAPFHESISELQDSLKDLMLYRPDGSSASLLSMEHDSGEQHGAALGDEGDNTGKDLKAVVGHSVGNTYRDGNQSGYNDSLKGGDSDSCIYTHERRSFDQGYEGSRGDFLQPHFVASPRKKDEVDDDNWSTHSLPVRRSKFPDMDETDTRSPGPPRGGKHLLSFHSSLNGTATMPLVAPIAPSALSKTIKRSEAEIEQKSNDGKVDTWTESQQSQLEGLEDDEPSKEVAQTTKRHASLPAIISRPSQTSQSNDDNRTIRSTQSLPTYWMLAATSRRTPDLDEDVAASPYPPGGRKTLLLGLSYGTTVGTVKEISESPTPSCSSQSSSKLPIPSPLVTSNSSSDGTVDSSSSNSKKPRVTSPSLLPPAAMVDDSSTSLSNDTGNGDKNIEGNNESLHSSRSDDGSFSSLSDDHHSRNRSSDEEADDDEAMELGASKKRSTRKSKRKIDRKVTERTVTDTSASHHVRTIPLGEVVATIANSGQRRYRIRVARNENDRATELRVGNFSRPHMRSFHFCWWCIFLGFSCWLAISPLLPTVGNSLGLSRQQLWSTTIASLPLATLLQPVLYSLCKSYGPRNVMLALMCVASIPMACIGTVQSFAGLTLVRFLGGSFGASGAVTQCWMDHMFAQRVVGATRSLVVGGWGVESSVVQVVIGSVLFPIFTSHVYDEDADKAWRTILLFPPVVAFAAGIAVYSFSDDTPHGDYFPRPKERQLSVSYSPEDDSEEESYTHPIQDYRQLLKSVNVWILFLQQACTVGALLTMVNALPFYFSDRFGLSIEEAAASASIVGWMGFARFIGGWIGFRVNQRWGLRGRLWANASFLTGQGVLCVYFPHATTLGVSIVLLCFISLYLHAALASALALGLYADPAHTGAMARIVNMAGGVGGVLFCVAFQQLSYTWAFTFMGAVTLIASMLSLCTKIRGHDSIVKRDRGYLPYHLRDKPHSNMMDSSRELSILSGIVEPGNRPFRASRAGSANSGSRDSPTRHLEPFPTTNHPQAAFLVDFTGTVSSVELQKRHTEIQQSMGTIDAPALPSQENIVRCTNDHACYTAGVVYGTIESPYDGALLERSASSCYCRECGGVISSGNGREGESEAVITASPETPVYVCLECENTFVCSACWRKNQGKVSYA